MKSYIYICNNFTGNKIHREMILKLSEKFSNIDHYVFVACNSKSVIGNNNIEGVGNVFVEYIYIHKFLKIFPIIKSIILLFFILKRAKLYKINWKDSISLSYTFWSDGILSLYLYFLFGTAFSTFVRVTDVSVFFRYGYHLRILFNFIANKAKYIYFPSIALKEESKKYLFLKNNLRKCYFLPNPLNDYWINNIYKFDNLAIINKKILFVGSFDINKNLLTVFNAGSVLYQYRKDFRIEFVGGNETDFKKLCKVNTIPEWVSISSKIEKDELLLKYRESNILLVPSFLETFGMVYLEAISQGCIAVCSKNQGVDGIFNDRELLYTVDPHDYLGISNTLNTLLDKDIKISCFDLKKILNPFLSNSVLNMYSCFDDEIV